MTAPWGDSQEESREIFQGQKQIFGMNGCNPATNGINQGRNGSRILARIKTDAWRGVEEQEIQEISDISTVCFEGSSERLREVRRPKSYSGSL